MGNTLILRKRADKSGDEPPRDEKGNLLEPWPLDHVELIGEAPTAVEFSEGFITAALAEGWASISKGVVVLHVDGRDLWYRILEGPGQHDDPEAPGGYRITHTYRCERKES